MRIRWAVMALSILALVAPAVQAQTITGSILGDITDASGARLPGAGVKLVSQSTGATRETVSDEVGSYRFDALQPVEYTVTVEMPGFGTQSTQNIKVPTASQVKIDFKLEVATASEEITVTEQAPLVETTENAIKTLVDSVKMQELPLKSRDFLDLALLAPGVVTDQNSDASDVTESISFGGMSERYKSMWLDGVDINDEVTGGGSQISAGTRTQIAQEAIQEFQVMANSYTSEFGRSATGQINVVTKSGTNDFHGAGFYFRRDDALQKPNRFNNSKPPFKGEQYGATLGGPIIRNKAHFFGSYERRVEDRTSFINISTLPVNLVNFARSLGYDTRAQLPFPTRVHNFFGKVNYELNSRHSMNLVYLRDRRQAIDSAVGAAVAADGGYDDNRRSYFTTFSFISLIGQRGVNELRVHRSYQYLMRDHGRQAPSAPLFLNPNKPTLAFPSVTFAGDSTQGRIQVNKILQNSFSYNVGRHSFKAGYEGNLVSGYSILNQNYQGTFDFLTDTPVDPNNPATLPYRFRQGIQLRLPPPFTIAGYGYTALRRDISMHAWYVNDSWRLRPNLTLNLGARYDLYLYRGDLDGQRPPTDIPQEQFWIRLVQGRYAGQNFRPLPTDFNNVSPRFGLSWDPNNDGKTVVRLGWGIYTDQVFTSTLRSTVGGYPGFVATQVANDSRQTLRPNNFFPNAPAPGTLSEAGGTAFALPVVDESTADLPYTMQYSGGVGREVAKGYGVSADYVYIWGLHFSRTRNINACNPCSPTRIHPLIPAGTTMNLYSGQNVFKIHQIQLRLDKRLSGNFAYSFGYTYGNGRTFGGGGTSDAATPTNQYDLSQDWGPTDNDVAHRITANGIYTLPLNIQFSSFLQFNTAPPYNVITGNDDNRDLVINDRPAGFGYNAGRGDRLFNLDMRVSKKFQIREKAHAEVLWEMFNVFNTRNLLNFQGNMRSAVFGQGRQARPAFEAQFGAKFVF